MRVEGAPANEVRGRKDTYASQLGVFDIVKYHDMIVEEVGFSRGRARRVVAYGIAR